MRNQYLNLDAKLDLSPGARNVIFVSDWKVSDSCLPTPMCLVTIFLVAICWTMCKHPSWLDSDQSELCGTRSYCSYQGTEYNVYMYLYNFYVSACPLLSLISHWYHLEFWHHAVMFVYSGLGPLKRLLTCFHLHLGYFQEISKQVWEHHFYIVWKSGFVRWARSKVRIG